MTDRGKNTTFHHGRPLRSSMQSQTRFPAARGSMISLGNLAYTVLSRVSFLYCISVYLLYIETQCGSQGDFLLTQTAESLQIPHRKTSSYPSWTITVPFIISPFPGPYYSHQFFHLILLAILWISRNHRFKLLSYFMSKYYRSRRFDSTMEAKSDRRTVSLDREEGEPFLGDTHSPRKSKFSWIKLHWRSIVVHGTLIIANTIIYVTAVNRVWDPAHHTSKFLPCRRLRIVHLMVMIWSSSSPTLNQVRTARF